MTNDDGVSGGDDEVFDEMNAEWEERHASGEELDLEEYCRARGRPDLLPRLRQRVDGRLRIEQAFGIGPGSSDPLVAALPLPNEAVTGYDVLRFLAEGGLGKVYEARDRVLDRTVALKFLRAGKARDPDQRRRFLAEARMTGSLDDPGVAPIYAVGESADGHPTTPCDSSKAGPSPTWYSTSTSQTIPGATPESGPWPSASSWAQFVSACHTVAAAHGRGVIHCDLKPSNIMVDRYGRVTVVDWGLTRDVSPRESPGPDAEAGVPEEDSRQGKWMGTPATPVPSKLRVSGIRSVRSVTCTASGRRSTRSSRVGLRRDCPATGPSRSAMPTCSVGAWWRRPRTSHSPKPRRAPPAGGARPPRAASRTPAAPGRRPQGHGACDPGTATRTSPHWPPMSSAWLADGPISAEREPAIKRAERWVRRNRGLCAAIVAAVTVLALGAGLVREQRRLDAARQVAEQKMFEGESLMAAGQFDRARVGLAEARQRVGRGSGALSSVQEWLLAWVVPGQGAVRNILRERIDRDDVQADARSCLAGFFPAAERAEFNILGDYWALLPHEETGTRRRIANPGERAADLAAGASQARDALAKLGASDGRDPSGSLAAAGIGPEEIARARVRAVRSSSCSPWPSSD